MNTITLLQINIRSLNSNKDLLNYYILSNKIDIVILSETWTKPNNNLSFNNYNLITKNRSDGYGGVGFLIHKKFSWKILDLGFTFNKLQALKVNFKYKNQDFNIISFYNNSSLNPNQIIKEFNFLLTHHSTNSIIAGDLNIHNSLWDSSIPPTSNRLGDKIGDIITSNDLYLLNDGSHTRFDSYNHSSSAIDISLCSLNFIKYINWSVQSDNLGSDHLPILITLKHNNFSLKYYTNWSVILKNYDPSNLDNNNIEEYLKDLIQKNTFPLSTNQKFNPKPWWNDHLQKLWNIKKFKQIIYNHNKNLYTALELKKSTQKLKIEIKKEKRKSWLSFLSSINHKINNYDIWKYINKIKSKKQSHFDILENKQLALDFLNFNFPFSKVNDLSSSDTSCNNTNSLEFKEKDIHFIIKNSNNTSPGFDKISFRFLKLLSVKPNFIPLITKYLNYIWNSKVYPINWKISIVYCFLKKGKDDRDIKNYRPICLLPIFSKIFNKLILFKINDFIDSNNILNYYNFGFRKGKGITDYLVELFKYIINLKHQNKKIILISLDISKAFDSVDKDTLLDIMYKNKFPEILILWISQFLTNRIIKIKNLSLDYTHYTNKGIPQGSCLSPVLFNIYTSEIHRLNNPNKKIFQYADDICAVISANNYTLLQNNINSFLASLNNILSNLKLQINVDKSHFLNMFSNRNNSYSLSIKINNIEIKQRYQTKILGVTFSNRLSLLKHFINLKTEIQKSVNLFKTITYFKGGAYPETLINIFKSLIKPKLDFAYILIIQESKSINKICQTIKNSCLRYCLGFIKTTPIPVILSEALEKTINLDIIKKSLIFISKQLYNNTSIGTDIKSNKSIPNLNNMYTKFSFLSKIVPFHIKTTSPTNLKIITNISNTSKSLLNKTEIYTLSMIELEKYKDFSRIFTDGSIIDNKSGIGIFAEYNNLNLSIKLNNITNIKNAEIIAIKIAATISLINKNNNIIIFTDSLSSCKSLVTALNSKTDKHFENQIIDLVGHNINKNFVIHWLPGHCGITGNMIADELAKKATISPSHFMNNDLILTDSSNYISKEINNIWLQQYNLMLNSSGHFYKNICPTPRNSLWFKNTNFSSENIKLINRLFSNHSYNKHRKYILKLESSPLCDFCNIIEDNVHIFNNCTKYNNIRINYPVLINKSLADILKNRNMDEFKAIIEFVKDINLKL